MALLTKSNNKQKPKFKSVICFEWKKPGHFANKCPSKRNNNNNNKLLLACASFAAKTNNRRSWFIDSGATTHMTMNKLELENIRSPSSEMQEVIVGDSGRLNVDCAGDMHIPILTNNKHNIINMKLNEVLYVPDICANLLSVGQLAKQGKTIVFDDKNCRIFDTNNDILFTAPLVDGLYKLNPKTNCAATAMVAKIDRTLWHRRLGHPCESSMNNIKSAVDGIQFTNSDIDKCIACVMGKQTRASYNTTGTRATACLELVHTDVCGPMATKSFGGARYLLTFVDDFTRKVFVYALKGKNEVFNIFVNFKNLVENQLGPRIKKLRSDNGTEFCNKQFDNFISKHGILHQRTAPYTPEQNGVAERMNRSLIEKMRCMLFDANLPKQYWAEAAYTAAYLMNRNPCRNMMNVTPEELWSKVKPNLSTLKVFGCKAMVHIPEQKRGKLDSKSIECLFMGYSEQSKAYRLYNAESRKIIISMNVTFFENIINKNSNNIFHSKFSYNKTILKPNEPITDENDDDDEDNDSDDDSDFTHLC